MPTVKRSVLYFAYLFMVFVAACSTKSVETADIKHYPIDSLEGIITKSGVQMDEKIQVMEMAHYELLRVSPPR